MDVSQFYQTWLHLTVEPGAKPDFYQLLGISTSEENADRIQAAAEQRFKQLDQVDFHAHLPEYRTILQHIMEAEMTLKTPSLRRQYDAKRTNSSALGASAQGAGSNQNTGSNQDTNSANSTYIDSSIYEYTKPGLLVRIRQWAFITLFVIAGVGVAAYMGYTVERNPDGSVKFASIAPVVKKQVPFTRAPGKEFPRPNTKPKQLGISRLERPSAKADRTVRSAGDSETGLANASGTGNGTAGLPSSLDENPSEGTLGGRSTTGGDRFSMGSSTGKETPSQLAGSHAGNQQAENQLAGNQTGSSLTGSTDRNTASVNLDEPFAELPDMLPSDKTAALDFPSVTSDGSNTSALEPQLSADSSVAGTTGETAGTTEIAANVESEETDLSLAVSRIRPRLRENAREKGSWVSPLQTAYQKAQQNAGLNSTTDSSIEEFDSNLAAGLAPQSEDSTGELAPKTNIVSNITDELKNAQSGGTNSGILPESPVRDERSGGTSEQPSAELAKVANTNQLLPVTDAGKALPPEHAEWDAQLADAMKEALVSPQSIETARKQAEELCSEAAKSPVHDAGCYAQYRAALRLACKAQNIVLAFYILDQMNEAFEMDLVQEKTRTAILLADSLSRTGVSLKDKQPIFDLVSVTSGMSPELNKAGLYQDSAKLYDLVYQAAANSFLQMPKYKKTALQKKERADQVARFHETFVESQKKLEVNPEDATANMKCALWICQMENDFDKAIPFFAKCGQKGLSELAADELSLASSKGDSVRVLQLADSWWELAHHIPSPLNEMVYAHALSLYQRLDRSVLANGEQARVAERIEKLRKTL